MAKNPNGFTKSGGNIEWGRKARKEEARIRGFRHSAKREAIRTGLKEG